MRLLYCIPGLYNSGGMERVLTEKVNILVKRGYSITIVTTDQRGRKPYFCLDNSVKKIDLGLNFDLDYSLPFCKKAFLYRRKLNLYRKALEGLTAENSFDIIISLCGKEINFWSKLKCPAKKVAEIHFAHDFKAQFIQARKKGWYWRILGIYLSRAFILKTKKLDRLVVLTKSDAKFWSKTNNNIIQIYNPSSIQASEMPNLSIKRFIAVGRLDEQKGFDKLIEIWKNVNKTLPDWQLDIYGSGPLHESLNACIQRMNLQDCIHLKGTTQDLKKEYLNAAGLIMTSRYEGFPLALIEAQSCGLPIIAFDCNYGPSEIITDDTNGFLIPMDNKNLMEYRIIELAQNLNLRSAFSIQAKNDSMRFTPSFIIEKWEDLFKSLTSK